MNDPVIIVGACILLLCAIIIAIIVMHYRDAIRTLEDRIRRFEYLCHGYYNSAADFNVKSEIIAYDALNFISHLGELSSDELKAISDHISDTNFKTDHRSGKEIHDDIKDTHDRAKAFGKLLHTEVPYLYSSAYANILCSMVNSIYNMKGRRK